jgi:hypothetical protein
MRSMQQIAHCAVVFSAMKLSSLVGAHHFKAKDALSEVGERLGKRGDTGVAEQLAAGPADAGVTKAALTKEMGPVFRLAMFEPFDVGRHGIAHAEIAEEVMARGIDDDQLPASFHHVGNIAEDLLIFVSGSFRLAEGDAAFFVEVVDGGDGEYNIKVVRGAVELLDSVGQDARLRELKLFRHGAEGLMTLAGIVGAFGERLKADDVARAMHRGPQAEHTLAAADFHHGLIAEINGAENLAGKAREIVAVVPHSHFLADEADALGHGGLTNWSDLIRS